MTGTAARTTAPAAPPRLAESHKPALAAADAFFGGFCVFMIGVTAFGWWRGELDWRAPLAVVGFLVANVVISQVSFRARNAYRVEVGRAITGGLIAPAGYLLVDGPLGNWWPGFLIMCLGGCIILGLLTQRPFWGRVLVAYYLALLTAATLLGVARPNWYGFALAAGVIAMVGLMWAQIMSLLGRTLKNEHDRTVELARARDALFAEMEVAQEIQRLLLPREPRIAGNLVSGKMLTATEVGGDYYDVIDTGRRSFLAIGDVSGHGVTSGLTMMMARASLLGALEACPDAPLGEIYRVLNRCLRLNLERMGVQMYMTFALIEYRGDGRFAAVGRHLPLLVHRRRTGEVEEIELDGMWLGVLDDLDADLLAERRFDLAPGDLLVLHTDGIVEHAAGREMYGEERLKELVRGHAGSGAAALVDAVLADVTRFSELLEDDMTLLVIDHHGGAVARPAPADRLPPAHREAAAE